MDNVRIAEIVLKLQMDDLKDAQMLSDYAEEVKQIGDTAIASALNNRAKSRLNLMSECERTIAALMQRIKDENAINGTEISEENLYSELYKKYLNYQSEKVREKIENL